MENRIKNKFNTNLKVTVGIPVRNGENFIEEAINSILNQTYQDFELIISDNNSNDNTEKICRKFMEKDKRIRYYKNEHNIGAAKNYNKCFKLSESQYYLSISHDDYLHPTFIEKSVKILDEEDSIHLVYAKALAVDENGKPIDDFSSELRLDSDRASLRFHDSICIPHPLMEIFGLIRSSTLKKTRLMGKYTSADRILLAEIVLLGKIHLIPEFLFFNRIHDKQHYMLYQTRQERAEWWDPKLRNVKTYPHWKLFFELYHSIKNSTVNGKERKNCYFVLIIWFKKNIGYLIRNLFQLDRFWKKQNNNQ